MRRLGPSSPGLIDFLKRQHRSYDALVFFSLYHATTVQGVAVAPERSILFPYLQVEPVLRFGLWSDVLAIRAGDRLRLGRRTSPDAQLPSRAFTAPTRSSASASRRPRSRRIRGTSRIRPTTSRRTKTAAPPRQPETPEYLAGRGIPFRRRHRLYGSFALYGGRVEPDNGCEEMLEYFDSYASTDGDTALVLMGVKMMKVPDEPYIRHAGRAARPRADDRLRSGGRHARARAGRSARPCVLESLAVGTPVLASARNEAAVEHCRRANAGLYYANRDEFVEALAAADDEHAAARSAGRERPPLRAPALPLGRTCSAASSARHAREEDLNSPS